MSLTLPQANGTDGTWTTAPIQRDKTPDGWDLSKTWRHLSQICDCIRAGDATEADWRFLHEYGHPTLRREMVKYVCKRHAGIV
jgi:hypothetical protein